MEGVLEVNFQKKLISFSMLLSRKSYLTLKTSNQLFNQKTLNTEVHCINAGSESKRV